MATSAPSPQTPKPKKSQKKASNPDAAPLRAATAASESTGISDAPKSSVRHIKKYPNRRLYDTRTSTYVTLSEVKNWIVAGEQILVTDAKADTNITRSILLQIILEEESEGVPMLSEAVLAQLIRFYGHAMQGLMGGFLEKQFQTLASIQAAWMSEIPLPLSQAAFPMPPQSTPILAAEHMAEMMGKMQENVQELFKQQTEQMMQMWGLKKP